MSVGNDGTNGSDRAENSQHEPITDINAYLGGLGIEMRTVFGALGTLLLGVARADGPVSADSFTAQRLGVAHLALLVGEEQTLTPVQAVSTALAIAEWITEHEAACEVGPGQNLQPPKWTQTEIGDGHYRHPKCLRAYFPTGTLLPVGCVIHVDTDDRPLESPKVGVYVAPEHQHHAKALLDRLSGRAAALNPFRGRAVRACLIDGLSTRAGPWKAIGLSSAADRDSVIVGSEVWAEIDLAVKAVRDRRSVLLERNLGVRRGVLLCGPPGTGKSAVSAVVARELVGEFTVIYVEAQAGERLLTSVMEEAQRLGGPVLVVLEDIDLWCRRRGTASQGLSELLQAMDVTPDAPILTIASTNDAATLDQAAIRTGRFDSVVEVGYPNRADAARILAALTNVLTDGVQLVDTGAVASALPEKTSGSDIREIVRRAVLASGDGSIDTDALLAEVGSGRYRATVPTGMYV